MTRTMNRNIIYSFLAFSFVAVALFAATSDNAAKQMLDRLKIKFSPESYFDAVKKGDRDAVKLLLDAGIPPNTKTELGITGLMQAAETGQIKIVNLLIEAAADLNLKDSLLGRTALMRAADKGYPEIAKTLIKAGADVNARSDKRVNFGIVYHGGDTALMYASARGDEESVRALLGAGADPSLSNDSGDTATIWAGKRGNDNIVKMLDQAQKK